MVVTQVHFAKLAGVTRATVDRKIKQGVLIKNEQGKLDPENEKNKKYLHKRMKAKDKEELKESFEPKSETDKEIKHFASLATIEQQLKVDKLEADVKLKLLLLKEKRGELISKKRLGDVCFSYLDLLNKNLLVIPQVFLDRVENYVKHHKDSKISKKDMMNDIAGYLTKAITQTKKQVEKKMATKYEEDIDED